MTASNNVIPEDYEDWLYRITYAGLGKIGPYIPNRIKPNTITLFSFISAMIACALLYFVQTPMAFMYWIIFNFAWYIFDALDGIHARLSIQTSEFGAFLDHFYDNVYFMVMFTVFVLKFGLYNPIYIYCIFARLTVATIVFIMQNHTGKHYISSNSAGLEFVQFNVAMFLTFLFPAFNPATYVSNLMMLKVIHAFSFEHYMFIKLTLLTYGIAVPFYFFHQIGYVKQNAKDLKRNRP